MGDIAGQVDPCARLRLDPLDSDVEGQLALVDVDGLVLVVVHVVWRVAGRPKVVGEAEGAASLLAGRLHYQECAQKPHCLTFFPRQRVWLRIHRLLGFLRSSSKFTENSSPSVLIGFGLHGR